jgi:hypothetical protein
MDVYDRPRSVLLRGGPGTAVCTRDLDADENASTPANADGHPDAFPDRDHSNTNTDVVTDTDSDTGRVLHPNADDDCPVCHANADTNLSFFSDLVPCDVQLPAAEAGLHPIGSQGGHEPQRGSERRDGTVADTMKE